MNILLYFTFYIYSYILHIFLMVPEAGISIVQIGKLRPREVRSPNQSNTPRRGNELQLGLKLEIRSQLGATCFFPCNAAF